MLLAGGLVSIGCGMDLPEETRIASTRPLAIRIEVVDPSADPDAPVRAEALPFERIRAVPFVVDEEDPLSRDEIRDAMQPRWLACNLAPIEGLGTCLANLAPLSIEDIPACPTIDLSMLDPQAEELPEFPSPCEVVEGVPAQPELTIPFDIAYLIGGDIELTMVAHDPQRGDTDRCLEQFLAGGAKTSADCVFVSQRISVGPDAVLLELAGQLGLPIEDFGTIPDPLPEPDAHPRIQSFFVREFDENDVEVAVFEPMRGEVITAAAGHRLDFETVAPEDELQTYSFPQEDGRFLELEEQYEGAWYTTWGTLLNGSSDDPLSLNSWTLGRGAQDPEGVLPPGERATLYYVLRDGRQGVDWWWFHVDVVEP